MTDPTPRMNQVNVVVSDTPQAEAFYRLLGVEFDSPGEWPKESGALHTSVQREDSATGGVDLELDNPAMASIYAPPGLPAGVVIIGFQLASSDAVDTTHARLTQAGHRSLRDPADAFWGARYAIVEAPDGHGVGLMGPVDAAKRFVPPNDTPN